MKVRTQVAENSEVVMLAVIFTVFGTIFPALAYTRWGAIAAAGTFGMVALAAVAFGVPAYAQIRDGGPPQV